MLVLLLENKGFLAYLSSIVVEILIVYILFKFGYSTRSTSYYLSEELKDRLSREFEPENIFNDKILDDLISQPEPNTLKYELADFDVFDIQNSNKSEIAQTLKEYGVGTCGPPGFYGTLDLHLELEKKIARSLGVESAILYSNSFTCINSVITCFCKRYDNIFYNERSNEGILRAISITKGSTISYSNLQDLKTKAEAHVDPKRRNFVITEGLFRNTGEIVDLPRLLKIKNEFKMRLILEDSTGLFLIHEKGTAGLFGIPLKEIDVIIGSLAHVLCGSGGFSAGSAYVTEYQRLAAQSYCFSASMPGFLAKNAICNLRKKFDYPALIKKSQYLISKFNHNQYSVVSDRRSPMIMISRKDILKKIEDEPIRNEELVRLRKLQIRLRKKGLRISVSQNPWPAIRILIKIFSKKKDIDDVVEILLQSLQ